MSELVRDGAQRRGYSIRHVGHRFTQILETRSLLPSSLYLLSRLSHSLDSYLSLLTVHCSLLTDHFFAASPPGSSLPWQFVNLNEAIRVCQSFGSLVVG